MNNNMKAGMFFGIGFIAAAAIIAGLSFKQPSDGKGSPEPKTDNRLNYKWYTPELPKSLSFAGENVPLDRDDIREQMDRELSNNYYTQNGTLHIIKLVARYFPIIEERLKANGIPDDFKYLCVAESALMNQTSKAGAVGFWQFMKDTAPRYGLEVNDEVDERYNVSKATDAACMYFKDAYAKFGSWTGAAASYNCGLGGFAKQVSYQRTNNYYNLMLPDETMRYIFRILTFKYILTDPARLGFIVQSGDMYKPYKTQTATITTSIDDLAKYAIDKGMTYRDLKILNPWLRDHSLTVKEGKSYQILLPVGKAN